MDGSHSSSRSPFSRNRKIVNAGHEGGGARCDAVREESATVVPECCCCFGGPFSKLQMLLMWRQCRFEVPVIRTDMAAMPLVEQHRIVTCRSAHVTSNVSGLRATCVRNAQQLSFTRAIG